jgi:hypothetical protein
MTMSCLLAVACIQAAAGGAYANPQDTGIWYIGDAPHTLHQRTATVSLGLAGQYWRAGVQTLGKASVDAEVPGWGKMHTSSREYGAYVEGVYPIGHLSLEAGLWFYRTTIGTNAGPYGQCATYSSGANTVMPIVGASYNVGRAALAFDVRGAESRAIDWNGNHQPSSTKGGVATITLRVSL